MDRRFVLAMILSTLVVVVFYTWLIPPPAKRPVPARADSTHAAGSRSPAAGDSSALSSIPPDTLGGPEAPDTTFAIDLPKATATFTTRGGGLKSWTLKQFEAAEKGRPVEMVAEAPEPDLILDIGGRRFDLSDRVFTVHRVPAEGGEKVEFVTTLPGGVQVSRRFTLRSDQTLVDFEVEVQGVAPGAGDAAVEVGWTGLPRAERTLRPDKMAFGSVISLGEQIERTPAGRFKKERVRRFEGAIHWVGARNKYFLAGLIPPEGSATEALARGDAATDRAGAAVRLPILSGAGSRYLFHVYLGPLDYWKLKDVGFGLEKAVDLGWKFILPLSHALLWLLVHGYKVIHNYGVVIILVSAFTRILFYPMTRSSMRSMQAMQRLQPEMERIRNKYKDDPARLNQEVMGLYKNHKVNPLGGCLPMILQMPVFIALYTVLANSVDLRHANFMLWIHDLSSPDTLFRIGTFEIHVLPILMAGSMFWQQRLTPTDPRQASLTYMMPLMMLFFFYGFPAGLALYWTVTNLLSVAQQYLINRERDSGSGPGPAIPSGPRGGKKNLPAAALVR